jgi:hypothetical protein
LRFHEKESEEVGMFSRENNQKQDVTGVLIYFNELFFHIIEGDDNYNDTSFKKIGQVTQNKNIENSPLICYINHYSNVFSC